MDRSVVTTANEMQLVRRLAGRNKYDVISIFIGTSGYNETGSTVEDVVG